MAALAPSAADLIVCLGTPPDVAAQRLLARNGGNSRLQKRPRQENVLQGLISGQARYAMSSDLIAIIPAQGCWNSRAPIRWR